MLIVADFIQSGITIWCGLILYAVRTRSPMDMKRRSTREPSTLIPARNCPDITFAWSSGSEGLMEATSKTKGWAAGPRQCRARGQRQSRGHVSKKTASHIAHFHLISDSACAFITGDL